MEHGKTLLVVTHDKEIAARAPRVIEMADGQIVKIRIKALELACLCISRRMGLRRPRAVKRLTLKLWNYQLAGSKSSKTSGITKPARYW